MGITENSKISKENINIIFTLFVENNNVEHTNKFKTFHLNLCSLFIYKCFAGSESFSGFFFGFIISPSYPQHRHHCQCFFFFSLFVSKSRITLLMKAFR